MIRRASIVFLATLISGLLLFVGSTMANQQHALSGNSVSQITADNELPSIRADETTSDGEERSAPSPRASRRISIPYGFADNLPLTAGDTISVSGHGACTEGEEVTVDVTITQTVSAPMASGSTQFQQTCTGELQTWEVVVNADPGSTFVTGPATACGVATTRAGEEVTDTFSWCKAVTLNWQLYLPLIIRQ